MLRARASNTSRLMALSLFFLAFASPAPAAPQCGPESSYGLSLVGLLHQLLAALGFEQTPIASDDWTLSSSEAPSVSEEAEEKEEPANQVPVVQETGPSWDMDPADAQVFQFYGTTLDCGPATALIMSRILGLEAGDGNAADSDALMHWTSGGENASAASAALSAMRALMGAGATGTTSFSQIASGIESMGGEASRVDWYTNEELAELVEAGQVVVILGRPNGEAWSNSHVNGGTVSGSNGGVDHFVVLSAYDSDTDTWTVNDPALETSVEASGDEVNAFRNQSTQGRLAMTASS